MLLQGFDVRLARWGLGIALIAVTRLAFMPGPDVPITTSWDKLDHWIAFFILSFLANHSFPRCSFWRVIALGLVSYGIAIEIVQATLTPDRIADAMDVLADSVGIVIYGLILQLRLWFTKPLVAD